MQWFCARAGGLGGRARWRGGEEASTRATRRHTAQRSGDMGENTAPPHSNTQAQGCCSSRRCSSARPAARCQTPARRGDGCVAGRRAGWRATRDSNSAPVGRKSRCRRSCRGQRLQITHTPARAGVNPKPSPVMALRRPRAARVLTRQRGEQHTHRTGSSSCRAGAARPGDRGAHTRQWSTQCASTWPTVRRPAGPAPPSSAARRFQCSWALTLSAVFWAAAQREPADAEPHTRRERRVSRRGTCTMPAGLPAGLLVRGACRPALAAAHPSPFSAFAAAAAALD